MIVANLNKDGRYDVLVSKNISAAAQFFETFRTFSQGEIHSLYWDGVGMDQNDVILFRIIGLGVENLDKYRTLKNRFKPGSTLICDNNAALHNFAKEAYLKTDSLIRTLEGVLFTTPTGSSLAEINELHSEFKELNRKKHGISTRHLQGYLDWFVFRKSLRYSVESSRRKSEAYLDAMSRAPFQWSEAHRHR